MTWQDKAKILFGYHWKATIAKLAGVSQRTITRWDKGLFPARQSVIDAIDKTYETWR